MGRLLTNKRDESSGNEIALKASRKRLKTGRFFYAIYSICGAQTLQKEIHSKKDSHAIVGMDRRVKPGGADVRAVAQGAERNPGLPSGLHAAPGFRSAPYG